MSANWLSSAIVAAAVISSLTVVAEAGGTLELTLVRYFNRHGHDSTWDHCDSFLTLFKTSKCDPFFKIKMKDMKGSDGTEWGLITTKVYRETDTVEFSGTLNKIVSNPIVRHFDKWLGPFELHVEVMDHDTFSAHDLVDNIHFSANIKPDGVARRKWVKGESHGLDSHLEFFLKVKCDPHYYGPSCTKRCVPRNDTGGHYTCTKDGDKKCLPTWSDLAGGCLRRDHCSPNPCLHDGNCSVVAGKTFRCACKKDYHGLTCAVRTKPCEAHDHCHNGGKCINVGLNSMKCACPKGWKGHFCDFDRNECSEAANPCQNGGTCINKRGTFACKCPAGFTGAICDQDVNECEDEENLDTLVCLHNSSCVNTHGGFDCICPDGFNGTHCELPVRLLSLLHRVRKAQVSWLMAMSLLLGLIVLGVGLLVWQRRRLWLRARLIVKSGHKETGASVHLGGSDDEPRLEFKNAVYEALDEREADREFTPRCEEKTGMTNEAYICENKEEYEKSCSVSPKKTPTSTPAHDQKYVYSSLSERSVATHDEHSVPTNVLVDKEDGYMEMPSEHVSTGVAEQQKEEEEEEEKLKQLFDDPANFPPQQPSPSRGGVGVLSSAMAQSQAEGFSVA